MLLLVLFYENINKSFFIYCFVKKIIKVVQIKVIVVTYHGNLTIQNP